jgi:phospholipid transport system substrate-binding protein
MRVFKILPVIFLLASMPALAEGPAPAPQSSAPIGASPPQVIEQLDDALLTAMKQAESLGYAGRYRHLAPVIERIYDFPVIAALVLGSHWRELSPAQQREFVATLRDYTIATYAARFNGYSGERFAIKSVQPMQPTVMVVSSDFIEADGKTHSFDYLMQSTAGQWRIVNVIADGVSDLALKQTEFTHVLELKGFADLIDGMKRHIARMARAGE